MLNASEPLRTLRELCQNFPFVAKSLSRAKVSREIEDEVAGLQARVWGEGFSGAFLNGRALPVVHENNLIGLLQTLQRELRTVDRLASLGLPASAVTSLISLPSPSSSVRIDAKHRAVSVLTDVARDKRRAEILSEIFSEIASEIAPARSRDEIARG